ncbi:aspartate/methionine/tyrosine aminotransferase [Halarchaeum rubridurum]|uniref:Aminotransferase n=1 Tax=Halarchaeum rubridurum TaxID=489911 RepID=A0A830FT09_9EURY|nr:pyridoxal phosphate-dependent aminotransferase [Halarchaeum rubridurum]MBP1955259.1 aspartate/methionine/tyrosine aminotransferase [Halarchaeum rubridurum]GGM67781.1 aspartate aminotransferase [Halarchaeum rubridurum]
MEYEEPLFFTVMQYAEAADRDVVDMVSGNPDWGAPDGIGEGLHDYADTGGEAFQYPPSAGLRELRERVAERRGVATERVIVTNGGGMANTLGMARALERFDGSEVLMADPVYPYYPGKAEMLGGVQRFVPVADDGGLDPADVRAAASDETACIVVNTPNNPTGAVYGEETMREFVRIAEANDAMLVSDEVYDHYDFTGTFTSALAFDSEHVVVTNSFSKTYAITGFRVGYAVLPERDAAAARTRNMLTNVATSRPAQAAVLRALETTDASYHEANRERLRERVRTFTAALDRAGAEYTTPEGAFYVLARFPDYPGTMANAKRLIDEAGVAGMPGEAFGDARSDWLRFALVTPRVETAAERLVEFF